MMELLIVIGQLYLCKKYIDFFNEYAYFDTYYCNEKAYINNFLKIVLYTTHLLPYICIVTIPTTLLITFGIFYIAFDWKNNKFLNWLFCKH